MIFIRNKIILPIIIGFASMATNNIAAMTWLGGTLAGYFAEKGLDAAVNTVTTLYNNKQQESKEAAERASSHKYPFQFLQCAIPISPELGVPYAIQRDTTNALIVSTRRKYIDPRPMMRLLNRIRAACWLGHPAEKYETVETNLSNNQVTITNAAGIDHPSWYTHWHPVTTEKCPHLQANLDTTATLPVCHFNCTVPTRDGGTQERPYINTQKHLEIHDNFDFKSPRHIQLISGKGHNVSLRRNTSSHFMTTKATLHFPNPLTQGRLYAPTQTSQAVLIRTIGNHSNGNRNFSFALDLAPWYNNESLPIECARLVKKCIDADSTQPLRTAHDQLGALDPHKQLYQRLIDNLRLFYTRMDAEEKRAEEKKALLRTTLWKLGAIVTTPLTLCAILWARKSAVA